MSSLYSGIDSQSAFSSISQQTKQTSTSQSSRVSVPPAPSGPNVFSEAECDSLHLKAKTLVPALLQSASTDHTCDIEWFKTEHFARQSSISFGKLTDSDSEKHKLIAKVTTKIPATVDEVMAILICDTSGRVSSSLAQLDPTVNSGHVIQTIYPREHEYIHPNVPLCNVKRIYRNLKKKEKDKPKLREMIYLDYLTIETSEDGTRMGVQVFETVDIKNLPPSAASFAVSDSTGIVSDPTGWNTRDSVGSMPTFTGSKLSQVTYLERSGIVIKPGHGSWSEVTMLIRINPGLHKWEGITSHKSFTMSYLRQLGGIVDNLSTYVYNCKAKFGSVSGAFGLPKGSLIECGWNPGHIEAFTLSQKADSILGRTIASQPRGKARFDPSRINNKSWLLSIEESSVSTAGGVTRERYNGTQSTDSDTVSRDNVEVDADIVRSVSQTSFNDDDNQDDSNDPKRLRELELAVQRAEAKALEAERKMKERDEHMLRLEQKLQQLELAAVAKEQEAKAFDQLSSQLGVNNSHDSQDVKDVEEFLEKQFNASSTHEMQTVMNESMTVSKNEIQGVEAFLENQFNSSGDVTQQQQTIVTAETVPSDEMQGVEAFLENQFNSSGDVTQLQQTIVTAETVPSDEMQGVEAFLENQFNSSGDVTQQQQTIVTAETVPSDEMQGVEAFLENQFNSSGDTQQQQTIVTAETVPNDEMQGVEAFLENQFNSSGDTQQQRSSVSVKATIPSRDESDATKVSVNNHASSSDSTVQSSVGMDGVEAFLESQFNNAKQSDNTVVVETSSNVEELNVVEAFLDSQFQELKQGQTDSDDDEVTVDDVKYMADQPDFADVESYLTQCFNDSKIGDANPAA